MSVLYHDPYEADLIGSSPGGAGWSKYMKLDVFDPAMCCSSGVCGADVDAGLVQFAADVKWLLTRGVAVQRYNLSQQPGAFVSTGIVRRTLQAEGVECLPLGLLDGRVVFRGHYPSRLELQHLMKLEESRDVATP